MALIEARLRQEKSFSLPSPLTLFGDSGIFQWEGDLFEITAATASGISLESLSSSTLL